MTVQPVGRMAHRTSTFRAWVLHLLRLAILAIVVLIISWKAELRSQQRQATPAKTPELLQVQPYLPDATAWGGVDSQTGIQSLINETGNIVGHAAWTSPIADDIVGFSGPTNVLIVFDNDLILLGLAILESQDTEDHVEAIRKDGRYRSWWKGLSWTEIANASNVDTVSGATLTSLAMAQSVVTRLGGKAPSLKFPEEFTAKDLEEVFPEAESFEPRSEERRSWIVFDKSGKHLGTVLSTSPSADNLVGYQGPTETLVALDPDGRVLRMAVRKSYDNLPYVDYLDEDWSWPELFAGLSLEQVAEYDLEAEGVEGVSGATMTSMAVAQGVIKMAQGSVAPQKQEPPSPRLWNVSSVPWGTVVVLTIGGLIGSTRLRGQKWVRIPFQLVLIGFVGFVQGDMLSQAMLVGWAQHGLPWKTSLHLILLMIVAVTWPTLSRRNLYCSHLCPHGALQQLLLPGSRRRRSLGKRANRGLSLIPNLLLIWVVIVAAGGLGVSLVSLEPFDAYLFRIAGWGTIMVFLVGIVASLFVPMAYCRYGCPTGALLELTRRHGRSDHLESLDAVRLLLLAVAVITAYST